MTYTVLKNNGWGDFHDEGEFNSLKEARAYCKAMTKGKEIATYPRQNKSVFWFEIYRGEIEDDSQPWEVTDTYYV